MEWVIRDCSSSEWKNVPWGVKYSLRKSESFENSYLNHDSVSEDKRSLRQDSVLFMK